MKLLLPVLAAVVWIFPFLTRAAPNASESQRTEFVRLYTAAQRGQADETDFILLRSYPLYPYLLAAQLGYSLKRGSSTALDQRLGQFFSEYPDVAIGNGLRLRWLHDLAERKRWDWLLRQLPPIPKAPTLQTSANTITELSCLRLRAKIGLNRTKGVVASAKRLWLVGHSQPKACDPLFAWLEKQGALTTSLIAERLALAQSAVELGLVQALSRDLPARDRERVAHWLGLMRNPERGLRQIARDGRTSLHSSEIRIALARLARRNTTAATELYAQLVAANALRGDDRGRAAADLGYVYMNSRKPEGHDWFLRAGNVVLDEKHSDWRVRSALFMEDWAAVQAWVDLMPPNQRNEDRWRYWRARALEALGDAGGRERARTEFAEIATRRGYYSYLAADRIQAAYTWGDVPVVLDKTLHLKVMRHPVVQRARELFLLEGFDWQARSEWRQLHQLLPAAELRQAALLAHEWGWHSESILAVQAVPDFNALALRYPLAYAQQIPPLSKMRGLDPAWVYGLTRSESLFIYDVRSPANAYGLMQLLPSTARNTAREIGMSWKGIDGLKTPEYNVRLGTAYLKNMLDHFGGLQALATGAYNAGPNAVERWLPKHPTEGALWAEIVPYNETQKYIRTVLENTTVFEWRLTGKARRLTDRLGTILPANQLPLD